MEKYTPQNVVIAGGGLVGGTLAADYALAFPDCSVTVYDADPQACAELAQEIDRLGLSNVTVVSSEGAFIEASKQADMFDNCVPIDKMGAVQSLVKDHLPDGALITNRGSAQAYAKAQIQPQVREGTYHFGFHPVVGRERKSGDALRIYPGTFKDQIGVIEYLPETASADEKAAHAKLVSINEQLGFNVNALPVHLHDRQLGGFSHENTGALMSLAERLGQVKTPLGATMLRASAGTTAMWMPIFTFNRDAVVSNGEVQLKAFKKLQQALSARDRDGLVALVKEAHDFRMEWPDADQPVDSLRETVREFVADGASADDIAEQVGEPLFFSVARTLGFKAISEELAPELERYGYSYKDFLNSSAKDSTLAAKYNPEQVADLLLENRTSLFVNLVLQRSKYEGFHLDVTDIQGATVAQRDLQYTIEQAAAIMGREHTPKPRRPGGGDGFDDLAKAVQPGVYEALVA